MELNLEQQKLIQSKNLGHSLIKGVAGSGKTTVAVHRIPFLLNYYCKEKNDKILMVTFNRSLTKYIDYIYKMIPDEGQMSLFLDSNLQKRVQITNIDKILYTYFMKYNNENKLNLRQATEEQQKTLFQQCINEIKKAFPDVKIMNYQYMQFLRKEISWMKSCGYLELEVYQSIDRIGRTGGNIEGPQKILKNSRTREAIYRLMRLYGDLLARNNLCSFEEYSLYALEYIRSHEITKYTHIIIDESQDLTKTQLDCLMHLYDQKKEYSSIVFVADTAQSIYDTAWLIKGRNFTSIGLDMTGHSNSLAKNYRTTTQIAEAAYSLISQDENIIQDENYVKPSLIDKQGNYPVLRGFDTLDTEIKYIIWLIQTKLSVSYKLKDIAIIARTNRILKEIGTGFGTTLPHSIFTNGDIDFASEDVKMLTMHSIKGLEFKVVIVAGLASRVIPNAAALSANEDEKFIESMERKLLYVGMTRATERLYMSYHEKPSRFIEEINPKFLKLQDSSAIHNFYSVSLKDYLFTDQIYDLYGKEETVRQWLLQELMDTYKYPLKLLDVEYKVQLFSKPGYVDIVVSIYRNNKKIPYILFEVKQPGTDLTNGLEQLKSYMSVLPECSYGAVSNGYEFIIWNRRFERIQDIPMFDLSMLSSSVSHYEYLNLVTGKSVSFLQDEEKRNEIIVERNGRQEVYQENSLTCLDVYANIAAGIPILLLEEKRDKIFLPSEWITSPFDSFVVTVQGDSMVDANIENGDRIIIRQQNTADNGQIIAVEVDGNTTLKRLRRMGNLICLIPENQNYEPIVVDSSKVHIMGVAAGILKSRNC